MFNLSKQIIFWPTFLFFFNSKELKKKLGIEIGEISVRPPACPYPPLKAPSDFQNSLFCWKGMSSETYLLNFLSVYPYVRAIEMTDNIVCFKFRSNSPFKKIIILFKENFLFTKPIKFNTIHFLFFYCPLFD